MHLYMQFFRMCHIWYAYSNPFMHVPCILCICKLYLGLANYFVSMRSHNFYINLYERRKVIKFNLLKMQIWREPMPFYVIAHLPNRFSMLSRIYQIHVGRVFTEERDARIYHLCFTRINLSLIPAFLLKYKDWKLLSIHTFPKIHGL